VRISSIAAAAALAFGVSAVPAAAVTPTTFAQFFQMPGTGPAFMHTGGDGGASFMANVGTAVAVLDFGPLGIYQNVNLNFSASSSAAVMDAGETWQQNGWGGSLVFTWEGQNLLTATFSHGVLDITKVPINNQSGGLKVVGSCGSSLCYTSDILDVQNLIVNNFALSFSGITNYGAAGGNFNASGSGTFAGAVPEPATWAMMIAGFGLVGAAARRRRMTVAVN
jgi:hypothetical protein